MFNIELELKKFRNPGARRVLHCRYDLLKNGRFFDLLSGDPSWPKFLTGTSHLYSKPIPANRMMFSDLELDIGKFGFETFLYFGQFCILLWVLDIVRGKVPFKKITLLFCIISIPVILWVILVLIFDIEKLCNLNFLFWRIPLKVIFHE